MRRRDSRDGESIGQAFLPGLGNVLPAALGAVLLFAAAYAIAHGGPADRGLFLVGTARAQEHSCAGGKGGETGGSHQAGKGQKKGGHEGGACEGGERRGVEGKIFHGGERTQRGSRETGVEEKVLRGHDDSGPAAHEDGAHEGESTDTEGSKGPAYRGGASGGEQGP